MSGRVESIHEGLLKLYVGKTLRISLNRGQRYQDHCERLQDEYFLAKLHLEKCVKDPNNSDLIIELALELIDFYPTIPSELKQQNELYMLRVRDLGRLLDDDDMIEDKNVRKVLGKHS